MQTSAIKSPFKLKGRVYTLTVLQVLEDDYDAFSTQLSQMRVQAPRLFERMPVVIDCSGLSRTQFNLQRYCQLLRQNNIIPVAAQGVPEGCEADVIEEGLAIVNASASDDKPFQEKFLQQSSPAPVEKVALFANKTIHTPLRSGQQAVCKGGDLIIAASVSHGAELLADGNIHVYGVLRGRALAGMSGDKNARIFCQAIEAELVSIAGVYRLSDQLQKFDSPCQVYLQDEKIQIERL